jgi:hypothetical protein
MLSWADTASLGSMRVLVVGMWVIVIAVALLVIVLFAIHPATVTFSGGHT